MFTLSAPESLLSDTMIMSKASIARSSSELGALVMLKATSA